MSLALAPRVALLCALGTAWLADEARAQDVSPEPDVRVAPAQGEPEGYAALIEAALAEHEGGRFSQARALLLRAHELYPNARTLRGLGKVDFELRNYGDSVVHLEQALVSNVRPLDDKLRQEVEALLARARVYVGEVHVTVDPDSAIVTVDGVQVASGPSASFALLVGDHVLEFHAHGRLPERRAVHVRSGERTSLRVVLNHHAAAVVTGPVAARPDTAPPESPDERGQPLYKNRWLWVGVGVLLLGAASGLGIALARDHSSTVTAEPFEPSSGVIVSNR